MSTLACPVCGSNKLEKITKKHYMPIPYGEPAEYEERYDHCSNCDEMGDYSGENEVAIPQAIEVAKKRSASPMLDFLISKGYRLAYMERALDLPQRTSVRWKRGEASASSIALIRTIRTYPWILEVADSGYDPLIAKTKLVEEALKCVHNSLIPITKELAFEVLSDANQFQFNAKYLFSPTKPQVLVSVEG